MRKYNWQIILGLSLVALSALLYAIHYWVFQDAHHIFIYMVGDIAFVPIEVLLVTLIIHRLLAAREKRSIVNKLNMVIGVFFSEVGTDLLKILCRINQDAGTLREELLVRNDWTRRRFADTGNRFKRMEYQLSLSADHLDVIKSFLLGKRDFMLRLLENQNLLEHEAFTNLLWATFHLTEELENRREFRNLPEADIRHLEGDINRMHRLIITQWLSYMYHLKINYPYLFSLSIRTNPFDPDASPVVTQ